MILNLSLHCSPSGTLNRWRKSSGWGGPNSLHQPPLLPLLPLPLFWPSWWPRIEFGSCREIFLFRFYKLRGAVAERLRKSYHANPDSEHPICSVLGSQLSAQIPDLKHSPLASGLGIGKETGPQEKTLHYLCQAGARPWPDLKRPPQGKPLRP